MKSNCLLEALKAKCINPYQNKIYKRGSWLEIFKKRWPHYYWYHKPHNKYYHYSQNGLTLTWLQQLWYQGVITEFILHDE